MATHQQIISAAHAAIDAAGGNAELARKLTALLGEQITPGRVQQWRYKGIRPKFVRQVSDITGIPPHIIRPDYYA